jgi:hypothetical protein
VLALLLATFLALLTTRDMVRLNFVTYDLGTEMMVYAHGTPDIKIALQQVQDISWRTTGAQYDVKVAYGEDGSWPLTWYMVDYPNNYFYGASPDATRLLDCPVVIAGSPQYAAVEDILGSDYLHFDYKYLWWPIQDYFGLNVQRVRDILADPAMRAALWDIICATTLVTRRPRIRLIPSHCRRGPIARISVFMCGVTWLKRSGAIVSMRWERR